ncbi:PKD domain-containing protein [Fluviicola taffensis]|uniref:PKD domain containing protein n=1 Tax=Fluviicola taffensis (strain DSM 16823 / NCIMB 13979 / RW262) TaxID=755732 RepID=F2IEF7_FLUTR|nr:PKD domain-containing protein [Fluviicola taffensis]AEA43481.1 PKD domain containing protein [Fluviicola taffensis DSM 16823]
MRKILLSLSLLTLTLQASAQTQIGNSNFEAWQNVGSSTEEPTNWNSFKTASGDGALILFYGSTTLGRSPQKRPGSTGTYSARIWSKNPIASIIANGNMTCGRINMGSSTVTDLSNHNHTVTSDANFSENFTDTPDSLVVWLKFKPTNTTQNDSARVSAVIHTNVAFKDPNDVGNANTIATAIKNINYTNGGWRRVSIPFNYVGNVANSAFIIVTFTTNKTPGGGSDKDSLLMDDMELVYVPKASFTSTTTSICPGGNVTFTSTSTNYPTGYSWNFGDGSPASTTQNPVHQYTNPGTYTAVLTVTNQWGSTNSTPVTITVNNPQDATFSYAQPTYCSNAANPTPTVVDAGTFSSTAGLSINATTGIINLAASTAGTYTVTNTTSGACPDTKTTSITINAAANSAFNYPSNTICITDGNQTPTTAEAGTFSSTAGLVFVSATTGVIDVANSTPGTYTITYSVPGSGSCPSSSTVNVTLTANPDATFTYAQGAYCINGTNPNPVFGAGASGGVFSSNLAGMSINSNSGAIDLSASVAGSYIVTNTIAAVGSCLASTEDFTVIINALPNVTLGTFQQICEYNPSFTLTGGAPAGGTYSGTGVSAGSFNPATAGLGTKTITYLYTDATTTCSNTATNTIVVDACLAVEDNQIATISVYPNPTDGKLTLSNVTGNTSFKVVSVSGQVVLDGVVSNTANTIDLSSFENGIYVLQLTQEQALQTIRIVKN